MGAVATHTKKKGDQLSYGESGEICSLYDIKCCNIVSLSSITLSVMLIIGETCNHESSTICNYCYCIMLLL